MAKDLLFRLHRRCALTALLVFANLSAAGELPLASLSAVHHMPPEMAARHLPVVARGVVTNTGGWPYGLTVQDGDDGIFVGLLPYAQHVSVGQRVLVRGTTDPGRFAPIILAAKIEPEALGALPPPYPAKAREMASGELDNRFVEVRGVVRATTPGILGDGNGLYMVVDTNPGTVHVVVARSVGLDAAGFVDSTIRAAGVVGVEFNKRRQALGANLVVNRREDISILRMSSGDPLDGPATPISDIFRWDVRKDWQHRIKVNGVLTLQRPGEFLILQDQDQAIKIESLDTAPLPLGSRFDAAGFAVPAGYGPILTDALVGKVAGRGVGKTESLRPPLYKASELTEGSNSWVLVRLHAKLLESHETGTGVLLSLDDRGTRFAASAPGSAARDLENIAVGSDIEITGVNEILVDSVREARGFRVLIRNSKDVTVLRGGPWINVGVVLWSALMLGLFALLCALWALMLRSRVRSQTAWIGESLEREKAGAWLHAERSRILELIGRNAPLDAVCEGLMAAVTSGPSHCRIAIGISSGENWQWFGENGGHSESETIEVSSRSGALKARILVHRCVQANSGEADRELIEMCSESLSIALEHRDLHERLVSLSLSDPLTQLPNRRSLDSHLECVLARAAQNRSNCALLALDMDHFKDINDTLGHAAGDTVLQTLAQRFNALIRKDDIVARMGGDEFLAVLDGVRGAEEAEEVARRLLQHAARPIKVSGIEVRPSLSIGIAIYPADGETAQALKNMADTRMYNAKMAREAPACA